MTSLRRLVTVLALASIAGGCGGSGSGSPQGVDFPTFFTSVYQRSEVGTEPTPLQGLIFVNQLTDDEQTFAGLLD